MAPSIWPSFHSASVLTSMMSGFPPSAPKDDEVIHKINPAATKKKNTFFIFSSYYVLPRQNKSFIILLYHVTFTQEKIIRIISKSCTFAEYNELRNLQIPT